MSKKTYIRVGRKYRPEEILHLIMPEGEGKYGPKRIMLDGSLVNIRSSRLFTFSKSLVCACCGIVGVFFVKEKHRVRNANEGDFFHLNLYALDNLGHDVLMTSDHIIPRSKVKGLGLKDNRQTMCCLCNQAKGDRHISNPDLAKEIERKRNELDRRGEVCLQDAKASGGCIWW